MRCNVCAASLADPIYRSPADVSITSLCEVLQRRTEVFFCDTCGHLQTPPLPNLGRYYDEGYKILLDSEEEDQLYEVWPEGKVYRADHQLRTLLAKVPLAKGAKVLDYGSGKGSTVRRLAELRPDIVPHLFDVSSMYLPYWERFARPEQWATHRVPDAWAGRFDVITAFYSLEHMVAPKEMMTTIRTLLRPGGAFYAIVPDVYSNVGDFVVADHVNHFSPVSFRRLLVDARFDVREIDANAHQSALVAIARRPVEDDGASSDEQPVADLRSKAADMANYWSGHVDRVRRFEAEHVRSGPAAIYGSGFYGTFLATCLEAPDRVVAFVDQNPFRQGKTLLDKPIVAPDDLPQEVRVVYVGLNPRSARGAIAELPGWVERRLAFFFP